MQVNEPKVSQVLTLHFMNVFYIIWLKKNRTITLSPESKTKEDVQHQKQQYQEAGWDAGYEHCTS